LEDEGEAGEGEQKDGLRNPRGPDQGELPDEGGRDPKGDGEPDPRKREPPVLGWLGAGNEVIPSDYGGRGAADPQWNEVERACSKLRRQESGLCQPHAVVSQQPRSPALRDPATGDHDAR